MAAPDPVTDLLRRDIIRGVYMPGERLIQADLAERYSVGRFAIHTALLEMTKEGLIQQQPNRGSSVRRVPLSELIELNETLRVLEGMIAQTAAANANKQEHDELNRIILDMRQSVTSQEFVIYYELDMLFHRRLGEIGSNNVAAEVISNLRHRSAHHQLPLDVGGDAINLSLSTNASIAAAVASADPAGSAVAMHSHFDAILMTLSHWTKLGIRL